LYVDSSALVKLVVAEAETPALAAELGRHGGLITSALADIEVRRAAARSGAAGYRTTALLAACELVDWDASIRAAASELAPPELGTLDSIHLATALSLGPAVAAFVTYDRALANAAAAHDLRVLSPA
jgi:hypothetical protein